MEEREHQAWGVRGQPNGWEMLEGTWRQKELLRDGRNKMVLHQQRLLTETFNGCLDPGKPQRGSGSQLRSQQLWPSLEETRSLARGIPFLAPRTQILGTDVSSGALLYLPFLYSQSLGS